MLKALTSVLCTLKRRGECHMYIQRHDELDMFVESGDKRDMYVNLKSVLCTLKGVTSTFKSRDKRVMYVKKARGVCYLR